MAAPWRWIAIGLAAWSCARVACAEGVPTLYAPGNVAHAARLPDGSLVIAGGFTAVAEVPRAGLAKIGGNGTLDPAWNPGATTPDYAVQIVAMAPSPGGDRIHLGTQAGVKALLTTGAGTTVPAYTATVSGSVDGFNSGLRTLAVDAQGRTYLAGAFAYVNGQRRDGLARLASDGSLDAGWKPATNSTVGALAIDEAGGWLYIGGAFVNVDQAAHLRIARVRLSDGGVDASWSPVVTSTGSGVGRMALAPDGGSLVVLGDFTAVNGTPRAGIARLDTATASLDAAWSPAVVGSAIESISIDPAFVTLAGQPSCCDGRAIARVSVAGSGAFDGTWTPKPDGPVHALLRDASHEAIAFGAFGAIGGEPALALAALTNAGGPDHTWPDVERAGSVSVTATETSGGVLMAGDFRKADQAYRNGLMRLRADATLDPDFIPPRFEGGGEACILALASDPQTGAVYAGGTFTQVGGMPRAQSARLDGLDGALDPTWAPAISFGAQAASVQAIAVTDDAVFLGGRFNQVGGFPHANVTRVLTSGSADPFFGGATNGEVKRIVSADDSVYIAGDFLTPRPRVARLVGPHGFVDASWNPTQPWVVTWLNLFDLVRVPGGVVMSTQSSTSALGGVVVSGELVRIDDQGQSTLLSRFDQPVLDLLPARDGESLFAAGPFLYQFALDDWFDQTMHPGGLAQVSLRTATLGEPESWSPGLPYGGGVPSLTYLGTGTTAVLAGGSNSSYGPPRPGLVLVDLPKVGTVFGDGFEQ